MLYSGLRTGKVTIGINVRLSRQAQQEDLELISTAVHTAKPMVFSIPELSVDINKLVKPGEPLEAYVRKNVLKDGLSFMPPDDVTWWESRTTLRNTPECYDEVLPVAVLCMRVAEDVPALKAVSNAHEVLRELKRKHFEQGLVFIPLLEGPHVSNWVYSLATHVILGLDAQGEAISLDVQVANIEDYQAAAFEQFISSRGIEPRRAADVEALTAVLREHSISCVLPVLQALSLLNCKNISSEPHAFQTRKTGEKKKGRGPLARAVYRTLKLTLPGRAKGTATIGHADSEATRAFHMVRGHFAVYTEQAKLFGKYTGRYWVPAHTRGTKEAGIVTKRYSIVAREEAL